MGLKYKEEGERREWGQQKGRKLLFHRKSTNRQRHGRVKGAEAREQNKPTNMDRNTHTGDKTIGWQEESSRISPVVQS